MKCPECGKQSAGFSEAATLVGFSTHIDELGEHFHDDNCLKRYYICPNGHRWIESLRRRCSNPKCDWRGKPNCFCHPGPKVDQWTDA